MVTTKTEGTIYIKRLKRVMSALKKEGGDAALFLSSAPEVSRSRDENYPYKQHSDFYYLTGSNRKDTALLVTTKCDQPIIFAIKDDPKQILWEGTREDPAKIARRCDAELVLCQDIYTEILPGMNGIDVLYYQNIPNTIAWNITKRIISQPSWLRGPLPSRFNHSDVILEPLRLIKDSSEIQKIQNSINLTAACLYGIIPLITAGATEGEVQAAFDYNLRLRGACPAFKTIVAAGASASVLHYDKHSEVLKDKQLLMIDCGAEYEMYCGDITRTYPIGGRFEGVLREIYSIVLSAQKTAIATIKHGVKMQKVYAAAAKKMIRGLKDLGVLKGDERDLFKSGAILPYFPHSIGHSLGLDVHDIGKLRADKETTLEAGMVITVEPGLYFQKALKGIPRCGIRIEDDVLVTKTGHQILGNPIPKEIADLEALMIG